MTLRHIRLPAIGGALTAVAGLLSHPELLNLLPEKWAIVLSGVGIIAQAFTKPVVRTPEEVEEKARAAAILKRPQF